MRRLTLCHPTPLEEYDPSLRPHPRHTPSLQFILPCKLTWNPTKHLFCRHQLLANSLLGLHQKEAATQMFNSLVSPSERALPAGGHRVPGCWPKRLACTLGTWPRRFWPLNGGGERKHTSQMAVKWPKKTPKEVTSQLLAVCP